MDKDRQISLMAILTSGPSKTVYYTAKEYTHGQMDTSMKESTRIIRRKAMEFTMGQIATSMMAPGCMTSIMAME
jgi:hypothetical protein